MVCNGWVRLSGKLWRQQWHQSYMSVPGEGIVPLSWIGFCARLLVDTTSICRHFLLNVDEVINLMSDQYMEMSRHYIQIYSTLSKIKIPRNYVFGTVKARKTTVKHLLLKTSRVYCSKRRDHNGSFQSQHFLHGCTRKFTSNSYFLLIHTMQSFKHHLRHTLNNKTVKDLPLSFTRKNSYIIHSGLLYWL